MYVRSQVTKKNKDRQQKAKQLIVLYRNQKLKVFAYLSIAKHKLQDQHFSTISLSNSDVSTNHHKREKVKIKLKKERTEIKEESYSNKLLCFFCCSFLKFPLT